MKCPHCKKAADIKSTIKLRADEIYVCDACGKDSQLKSNKLNTNLLGGLGAGLIIFEFSYLIRNMESWIYVSTILVATFLLLIFLGFKAVRLQKIEP